MSHENEDVENLNQSEQEVDLNAPIEDEPITTEDKEENENENDATAISDTDKANDIVAEPEEEEEAMSLNEPMEEVPSLGESFIDDEEDVEGKDQKSMPNPVLVGVKEDSSTVPNSFTDVDLSDSIPNMVAPTSDLPEIEEPQSQRADIPEALIKQLDKEQGQIQQAITIISSPPLPPRDHLGQDVPIVAPMKPPVSPTLPPRTNISKNENLEGPTLPPREPISKETSNSLTPPPPALPRRTSVIDTTLVVQTRKLMTEGPDVLYQPNDMLNDETLEGLNISKTWEQFLENPTEIIEEQTDSLMEELSKGVPEPIHSLVWQTFSNINIATEERYNALLAKDLAFEDGILDYLKDPDTDYVSTEDMGSIFNVIRSYYASLSTQKEQFDTGITYATIGLLSGCENEEIKAFSLLEALMIKYRLGELFQDNGFALHLYCLDRMLEEDHSELYNHLMKLGIKSSMFVERWFKTFFVFLNDDVSHIARLLDIIFAEGTYALIRFALILMVKNEETIMKMEFDELLQFFRLEIIACYKLNESSAAVDNSNGENDEQNADSVDTDEVNSVIRKDLGNMTLNIDQFVKDAMTEIELTPAKIRTFSMEYEEIHRVEHEKEEQFASMRSKNEASFTN